MEFTTTTTNVQGAVNAVLAAKQDFIAQIESVQALMNECMEISAEIQAEAESDIKKIDSALSQRIVANKN